MLKLSSKHRVYTIIFVAQNNDIKYNFHDRIIFRIVIGNVTLCFVLGL
jgi:hypothetical protein